MNIAHFFGSRSGSAVLSKRLSTGEGGGIVDPVDDKNRNNQGSIFIVADDVEAIGGGEADSSPAADEVGFGGESLALESPILIDCWQEGHLILLPRSSSATRITSPQLGQLISMIH